MTANHSKVPMGELSTPSTNITSGVAAFHAEGSLHLSFEFDRDGDIFRGGLRFVGVRSYRWRAEAHCTAWHIEGAFDTIAAVPGSAWLAEVLASTAGRNRPTEPLQHLMVFIDSAGCYEAIARSWELLADEASDAR